MHPYLDSLSHLSAAEQFFEALELPFDQGVLNVSRLHILKGFHDRLRKVAFDGLDDAAARDRCRAALAESYDTFAAGKGSKTFKVFDKKGERVFVPLADLRRVQ